MSKNPFPSCAPLALVAYWVLGVVVYYAPIAVFHFPFWGDLLVLAALFIPLLGVFLRPVLYIVAMFSLGEATGREVVAFWIAFAVYLSLEFIPAVIRSRPPSAR